MEFKKSPERRFSRIGAPLVSLVLALGVSVATPAAAQSAAEDVPDYSFADCPPLQTGDDPARSTCVHAVVVSGKMVAGKLDQSLTKEMRLTFGNIYNDKRTRAVFGRLRGEEFQVRPGIFDTEFGAVYGRPEYAGVFAQPAGADFAIKLGIKIRLTRPFVLGLCEIGNNSDPILLNLTTGTTAPPPPNEPIKGKPIEHLPSDGDVKIGKTTHVDNAFRVPRATGCIYKNDPVSGTVSAIAGLPSEAGHNTMIMDEYIFRVAYNKKP